MKGERGGTLNTIGWKFWGALLYAFITALISIMVARSDGLWAGTAIGILFLTALVLHSIRKIKIAYAALGIAFITLSLAFALFFRDRTSGLVAIFTGWFAITYASNLRTLYKVGSYGQAFILLILTLLWYLIIYLSEWPLVMLPAILIAAVLIFYLGDG